MFRGAAIIVLRELWKFDMPANNIRRILTPDEIKYMTENSGKIPITEITKGLRMSGVQIRLFAKTAGIILSKCKTTPGR